MTVHALTNNTIVIIFFQIQYKLRSGFLKKLIKWIT